MKYLTVGTRKITKELFRPVEDVNGSIKPRGGLWLTEYNELYNSYNDWVDFLINNSVVFFYKSRKYSMWEQPCSLVTLKANANIFYLQSRENLDYLINNYSLDNKFSYQEISHIYDGVFINMFKLIQEIDNYQLCKQLFSFDVNSLILFNLDCIDYYQKGTVNIEPFDYEYGDSELSHYEINIENERCQVVDENVKKKILIKK